MEQLNHQGIDGYNSIYLKNLFISHHHFWITPEEYEEQQPLKNSSGNLYISFDGRIDNRDEIIDLIDSNNKELIEYSDASLLLQLYERYGENCFEKLIGPYSIVIYDKTKKRVIGARDPLAERGFFYHINNNTFIAASEESAILSYPTVSRKIDEKAVSHFFAMEVSHDGSTFFEDIKELLPGNLIILEIQNLRIQKFREFKPKRIRYKDDNEYAEHYKELLEKSVISRMRCTTPVSIMLSGGMDSSSIVPFAVKHNPHNKKVRAISWTFNKLKECDERKYINKTEDMYDLKKVQFNADTIWPLKNKEQYFQNPNTPVENPYRELKQKTYSLCSQNGSRLIFNGWYADRFYAGYDYWLLDLIKDLKINRLTSDLIWLIKENGLSNIRKNQPFRNVFGFLKFLKPKRNLLDSYSWLSEYAKSQVYESMLAEDQYDHFPNPKRAKNMLSTIGFFGQSSEHFHLSKHSIELECPYRDLRLVQFMLNIPSYQLFNKGTKKYIAKNAMNNLLPSEIVNRNSPTLLTPLFNLGMQEKEIEYVQKKLNSNDEWTRYVNKNDVQQYFNTKVEPGRKELVVWQCISFISWLDNLQNN